MLPRSPGGEWLGSYLRAAQAAFFQMSPTEMSNIVWALAKLGHAVPAKWLDSFLMVAQWRFPSFSAKTLSVVAWAVASLGHMPSNEWLVSFEQQVWDVERAAAACCDTGLRYLCCMLMHVHLMHTPCMCQDVCTTCRLEPAQTARSCMAPVRLVHVHA